MIKRLWDIFKVPGGNTTPHHRGATFFWHWGLGILPGALLGTWGWEPGLATALTVGVVYWGLKERQDIASGGSRRDSFEDSLAVALGGTAGAMVPEVFVPVLLGHLGALIVTAANPR